MLPPPVAPISWEARAVSLHDLVEPPKVGTYPSRFPAPGLSQRRDEPFDRTALAGSVPALEDYADRRPELRIVPDLAAQYQPQLQQPVLSCGKAGRYLVRGEHQAEIQSGEYAALASHARHASLIHRPN
jgi:hypothetical protein